MPLVNLVCCARGLIPFACQCCNYVMLSSKQMDTVILVITWHANKHGHLKVNSLEHYLESELRIKCIVLWSPWGLILLDNYT